MSFEHIQQPVLEDPASAFVEHLHQHGNPDEAAFVASGIISQYVDLLSRTESDISQKVDSAATYLEERQHNLEIALYRDVPIDREKRTMHIRDQLFTGMTANRKDQDFDLLVTSVCIFEQHARTQAAAYMTRPADTYDTTGHLATETAERTS